MDATQRGNDSPTRQWYFAIRRRGIFPISIYESVVRVRPASPNEAGNSVLEVRNEVDHKCRERHNADGNGNSDGLR